jgi:hypothetical protein
MGVDVLVERVDARVLRLEAAADRGARSCKISRLREARQHGDQRQSPQPDHAIPPARSGKGSPRPIGPATVIGYCPEVFAAEAKIP